MAGEGNTHLDAKPPRKPMWGFPIQIQIETLNVLRLQNRKFHRESSNWFVSKCTVKSGKQLQSCKPGRNSAAGAAPWGPLHPCMDTDLRVLGHPVLEVATRGSKWKNKWKRPSISVIPIMRTCVLCLPFLQEVLGGSSWLAPVAGEEQRHHLCTCPGAVLSV